MLQKADYVGIVSGIKVNKFKVFNYDMSQSGAPLIEEAPLTMESQVEDIYETQGFENFILSIQNTYVEEAYLNENNKINYHTLKPVLFEMPTYGYFKTGDVIENVWYLEKT